MSGLFAGTPLERPVTCESCGKALQSCECPRGRSGAVVLPKDQRARVRRERRRGKFVTVVYGLDPRASDRAGLLKSLQTRFGAGGTVTDDGFELQGDHRDAVLAVLQQMGYPAKAAGG
jgi:translation initiation factor 1